MEIEKQVKEMGLSEDDLGVEDKITREQLDEMLLNNEITMNDYKRKLKEL